MVNIKNLTLLLILYTSLIIGFIFNENLNFGTYYDWIQVNSLLIEDFSKNFSETFFNYHKTGNRHSPIYSIFLSFFYKLGLNIDFIRLFHLHICLGLIFLFYKCLVLRFEDVNKSTLQILSMFIFLSPTYRSLSIWPDSRLPGLIFFVLSVYFFLKFRKKKEKKIYNAYLCSFSLILSSYISPNFSLFSIFFYPFFYKFFNKKNFLYLILFNILLTFPIIYYIFIEGVNFISAGTTPGNESEAISLSLNISNKILIISSILFFHLIPIIFILTNYIDFVDFMKKKIVYFFLIFIILAYFFDYQSYFTGGGFFFQLSLLILDNNLIFYCISFFTLFYTYFIAQLHKTNFVLISILILSNIQNTIYHKYYEPLVVIIVFLLFSNLKFSKFYSKENNIILIYIFSLFFIILRYLKLLYNI